MSQIAVEGVEVKPYHVRVIHQPVRMKFRAHRSDCVHAGKPGNIAMSEMVKAYGHDSLRDMVNEGVVVGCRVCHPDLLIEQNTTRED